MAWSAKARAASAEARRKRVVRSMAITRNSGGSMRIAAHKIKTWPGRKPRVKRKRRK